MVKDYTIAWLYAPPLEGFAIYSIPRTGIFRNLK